MNLFCILENSYSKGDVLNKNNLGYNVYNNLLSACFDKNINNQDYSLYEVRYLNEDERTEIEIIKVVVSDDLNPLTRQFFGISHAMPWFFYSFNYKEEFLEEYITYIYKRYKLKKHKNNLPEDLRKTLYSISQKQILSEKFIKKHFYILDAYNICKHQKNISDKFKEEYVVPLIDWESMNYRSLDDDFFVNFMDKLIGRYKSKFTNQDWLYLSINKKIADIILSKYKQFIKQV